MANAILGICHAMAHSLCAAFDNQCTAANPHSPLTAEIRKLLLDSYYGRAFVEVFARQRTEAPRQ